MPQQQKQRERGCDASTPSQNDQVDWDNAALAAATNTASFEFHPPAAQYEKKSAFAESRTLIADLWRSHHRLRVAFLAVGIAAVLLGNIFGQIRLNEWNGSFFDALAQRNVASLLHQLLIFLGIVIALLTFVVAQTWMQQMLKVRLREWLTHHLLNEWLIPGRAYRLGLAGQIGVNPDQRIEQDTRQLTELSAGLGIGLFQATLLLVSFISILWALSSELVFQFNGSQFSIPGYMVWCAILYALIGSVLTWLVGRPLISLNADLYAREAELRFALVRVNESAESIALCGGECDERRQLNTHVGHVIRKMCQLSGALSRLTWITSGYGWIAIVVPIIVASPGYFSGSLSIGRLMMVVGAFNQVQSSLRWFVDQFPAIADWRATLQRVSAFKAAVEKVDAIDKRTETIDLVRHPGDKLAFNSVSIQLSDGRVVISDATVEIGPGERVLIVGESGVGKSTLFRALAGLWPWGSGTILFPDPDAMMFMPQRPYMPLGTLRMAINYPDPPTTFETHEVAAGLKRVGLTELLPMLDAETRLDKELSLGQQQLVAFARMLLHRPSWIFLDEATSALDEVSQRRAMSLFDHELKGTTVVSIGHRPGLEHFHNRVLHLRHTPRGAMLDLSPPPKNVEALQRSPEEQVSRAQAAAL